MTDSVLQAAWEGWWLVFSWPNILYPVAGTLAAMLFALLPGLTGATLMAIAIPLTFYWDPLSTMLVFGALVGGATFMGSVTSILFNIPGRTSSVAALFDGHPLARQGQARTAIGCSAAASALGSTFGVLVLIALIPFMREALLSFGPSEFVMLTIWGLTTLAALSRESMIKGLAAASLGLMIAFVGYDPRTAELRYTFDLLYLRDGLALVPAFLGLYALAEVIDLMRSRRKTIAGTRDVSELGGSAWQGARAVFRNFGLFLRSSVIGTVVGIIPGIGASVAGFVAYGQAAQWEGRRGKPFGTGNIRGVLAPEAANDAKDGGSLVPTLMFGIPGGTGTAMLLGALTVHGLEPGRAMLGANLSLVFVLIWSLFLSNWLTSILGVMTVSPLARLTTVRTQLLLPLIFVLALGAAYVYKGRISDVVLACAFGLVGYAMKKNGWPRVPMVIALVLGPLFEESLHLTLRLQELGRIDFWSRPITLGLVVLTIASLLVPVLQGTRTRERRS
jgi:TctA family transporter